MKIIKFLRSLVPHVHVHRFHSYALTARIDHVSGVQNTLYVTVSWRATVTITRACACGTLSIREQYGAWRRSEAVAKEDQVTMLEVLEKAMPQQDRL